MAPEAESKIRHRRGEHPASSKPKISEERVISSVEGLKDNEVAIDGVIYDLDSFVHPGGSTIGIFGGNDVTVQYKMIHTYHTSKHLEKMRKVGSLVDYRSEYMFDTPFERELKAEVFKIVRRGKEFGTYGWYFRCAVYLIVFFGLQYRWVVHGSSISLAIFYGIAQALIGMNVQHDANHGAASKNPWINDVLGLGADMIGSSRWLWMEQHWTHHAHTNNADKDPDATTAEPFLLFNHYSVDHVARKWFHKFQAIYATFLMSAYWLASVTNTEVLDLKHSGAAKAGIRMENGYIKGCRKYATALRILYIYVNIITPFQRAPFLTAFGHVMLMGVAGSLVLAILFSMSHNFQGAERHPTSQNDSPVCWFKSQVETSCTYGGFVSGALTGGLNFQIEHHLFPRMSSAWYPYIAPTVRDVCQRHGVRYTYYPWMWQNWRSTLQYMHETGNASWKEGNPYSG